MIKQSHSLALLIGMSVGIVACTHSEAPMTFDSSGKLFDTEWIVEDIASGGTIDRSNITLNFSADGTLTGSTGCNRYNTTFTGGEGDPTVFPIATTKRACPQALMTQENAFVSVLGNAATYVYDDVTGAIFIEAADGRMLRAMPARQEGQF